MALTGNETLYVLGQDANGRPAASEFQTTTADIAALAGSVPITDVTLTGSVSGSTTLQAAAVAAGTVTLPPITGTASVTPNTALWLPDLTKSSAQIDAVATTTLASVTGLTQNVAASSTYKFRCVLPGTANAAGGVKYAFAYTTATVSSLQAVGKAFTASGVAVQETTTTASQTSLVASTSAAIYSEIEGLISFGATAGAVTLQFAQNAATALTSSVYQNSYMEFVRIA